jgi:hypothetical protein
VLGPDEKVAWVYGPRFNPSWERYVTHPGLLLAALGVGVLLVGVGWLLAGGHYDRMPFEPIVLAIAAVLGSIFVLGIASGYFTRLVVTDGRLLILQGREVCRSWRSGDLPLSLIRYSILPGETGSRTIDVDAVKTMLGGSADQFADAKTILRFGKQVEQIKSRENRAP